MKKKDNAKKHPLNSKLITPLEVFYLSSLTDCRTFDSIVCAKVDVSLLPEMSRIFCLEDNSFRNSEISMNLTVALEQKNDENHRVDHLISTVDKTLVHFRLSSSTDPDEREIVKTVFKDQRQVSRTLYSEDASVFDDFDTLIKVAQKIDESDWSESVLCRQCPVMEVGVREDG